MPGAKGSLIVENLQNLSPTSAGCLTTREVIMIHASILLLVPPPLVSDDKTFNDYHPSALSRQKFVTF